jgi:hypothetical protein
LFHSHSNFIPDFYAPVVGNINPSLRGSRFPSESQPKAAARPPKKGTFLTPEVSGPSFPKDLLFPPQRPYTLRNHVKVKNMNNQEKIEQIKEPENLLCPKAGTATSSPITNAPSRHFKGCEIPNVL